MYCFQSKSLALDKSYNFYFCYLSKIQKVWDYRIVERLNHQHWWVLMLCHLRVAISSLVCHESLDWHAISGLVYVSMRKLIIQAAKWNIFLLVSCSRSLVEGLSILAYFGLISHLLITIISFSTVLFTSKRNGFSFDCVWLHVFKFFCRVIKPRIDTICFKNLVNLNIYFRNDMYNLAPKNEKNYFEIFHRPVLNRIRVLWPSAAQIL